MNHLLNLINFIQLIVCFTFSLIFYFYSSLSFISLFIVIAYIFIIIILFLVNGLINGIFSYHFAISFFCNYRNFNDNYLLYCSLSFIDCWTGRTLLSLFYLTTRYSHVLLFLWSVITINLFVSLFISSYFVLSLLYLSCFFFFCYLLYNTIYFNSIKNKSIIYFAGLCAFSTGLSPPSFMLLMLCTLCLLDLGSLSLSNFYLTFCYLVLSLLLSN